MLKKAHWITIAQNILLVMTTFLYLLNFVLEEFFLVTRIPFQWNQSHKEQINEHKDYSYEEVDRGNHQSTFLEIGAPQQ